MKQLVFVGLLLFFLQGFAQTKPIAEKDLPAVVLEGFELVYPDLPSRTWEQRNARYVAIVKYDDRTEFTTFLEDGEWAETRCDVEKSALPEKIVSYVDSHYEAYRAQSFQYVEENGGGSYYVVSLILRSNRTLTTELIFDMGGEIQMVDGLPVYESSEGRVVVKDDETKPLRPGIQKEAIDENKGVPEAVLLNLTKRYGDIKKIEWTKTDMEFHRGLFRFRDENIATEWDNEGNQVSVITFFNKKNAIYLIQKFLEDNHPRSTLIHGERVVYEGRYTRTFPEKGLRNYFVIEISDRPRGVRKPTFYTVYFDHAGQLEMIVEKEVPDENK
jgi:hypothetical protein